MRFMVSIDAVRNLARVITATAGMLCLLQIHGAHAETLLTGCADISLHDSLLSLHDAHEGRVTSVLNLAMKAIAVSPACSAGYLEAGHAKLMAGRNDEAVADFTHAESAREIKKQGLLF